MTDDISDMELDALREVGNIGASHAANALSEMIGRKVEISVPELDIIPLEKIPEIIDAHEEIVVGVYLILKEDIDGSMLLLFKKPYGLELADILTGQEPGTTKEFGEMEVSVIEEVGNIMASAFSSAIADFGGLKVIPSPPAFAMDLAESILNFLIVELGQKADTAIFFNTQLKIEPSDLVGHLFVSPDPESLRKILDALMAQYGM